MPPVVLVVEDDPDSRMLLEIALSASGYDVVTAVNGRPVKSVGELKAATAKAKGAVALLVRRGDASMFVPVEIS